MSTTLYAARPVITAATMPQYIGRFNVGSIPVTLTASCSPPCVLTYYRFAQNEQSLDDGSNALYYPYPPPATMNNVLTYNDSDGRKTIFTRVYDQYYNASVVKVFSYDGDDRNLPHLQLKPPTNVNLRIVGGTGSEDYAGIQIASDGGMTIDRTVKLYISAQSPIDMTYRILSTSSCDLTRKLFRDAAHGLYLDSRNNFDRDIPYVAANATPQVDLVPPTDGASYTEDFKTDVVATITGIVTDAANNSETFQQSIRLNTCVYKTTHAPLRQEDTFYRHQLWELNSGNNQVPIPRSALTSADFVRAWPDIFFPKTHGYPTDLFGNMTSDAKNPSSALYDKVRTHMVSGVETIWLDSEGRPETESWTTDGTKNYPPMLSSSTTNLQYWIIDNTGHGDIQLEFEWFDLNPNVYGPPYNAIAPYRGDVLVVYDATANGALVLSDMDDPLTGRKQYSLGSTNLLREIAAYTGSGGNVLNLTNNGRHVGANPRGGFNSGWIRNVPLLVIMLFTDAGGQASGFKLKSSPQHQKTWLNYHIDEKRGHVWVHKRSSTPPGAAHVTLQKLLTYDYMDKSVVIDSENGTVTFDSAVTGEVRADYTYHTDDTPLPPTFLASEDDFVAYMTPNAYVLPVGEYALTSDTRSAIWDPSNPATSYGRIISGVTWNTDTGMLEFEQLHSVPLGRRIFAEYTHHTYKRLASDGYGDLIFNDPIVVADSTPAYPDYTYADIAVVNEGDAMLEQGKMIFVGRGYDTDGKDGVVLQITPPNYNSNSDIVDQVLDINRPWDIQLGTPDETYKRMACAFNPVFIWDRGLPKSGGTDSSNKSATGILSSWRDGRLGDSRNLDARNKIYGRVVWVIGETSGSNYPQNTTSGPKRCSLEVSGRFYTNVVT